MKIVELPAPKLQERLYDKLMLPIMFVLRGFRTDSLQETHVWHPYSVDAKKIDLTIAVENHGKDKSRFAQGGTEFMFHAPIFGGWRDFSVYEVDEAHVPFHIGWILYGSSDNKLKASQVHRLPIKSNQIRLLDGNSKTWGYFFALNSEGIQIPLRKVGSGKIGDGTFKNVKLF